MISQVSWLSNSERLLWKAKQARTFHKPITKQGGLSVLEEKANAEARFQFQPSAEKRLRICRAPGQRQCYRLKHMRCAEICVHPDPLWQSTKPLPRSASR